MGSMLVRGVADMPVKVWAGVELCDACWLDNRDAIGDAPCMCGHCDQSGKLAGSNARAV